MTTKSKGIFVRQKITDLATKLNVPFQNIQTAFIIEMPESFSKTIMAINTISLQRGWVTATSTVSKSRDFKEAFNDIVKNMIKIEKSFER